MTNREKIIDAFHRVKDLGWVVSHRRSDTGIGKTFEDYVGVVENNLNQPDLYGYEIKAHRKSSSSYVTLFTKSPSSPKGANAFLRDNFGEVDKATSLKKLHTSFFADRYNNYCGNYSFKFIHCPEEEKIYIGIYDAISKKLLNCDVYYTYSELESALREKASKLLFVKAQRKRNEKNEELFYYSSAELFTNPPFDSFLQMLDNGEIMYDIRIGSYKSGVKRGQAHDHGSGFRIRGCNLHKLYQTHEVVE